MYKISHLTIDARNEFNVFKEGLFDFPLMLLIHIESQMAILYVYLFLKIRSGQYRPHFRGNNKFYLCDKTV